MKIKKKILGMSALFLATVGILSGTLTAKNSANSQIKEVDAWTLSTVHLASSLNEWSTVNNPFTVVDSNSCEIYEYTKESTVQFAIVSDSKWLKTNDNNYMFHSTWSGPAELVESGLYNFKINLNCSTNSELREIHIKFFNEYSGKTQIIVEQKAAYTVTFKSEDGSDILKTKQIGVNGDLSNFYSPTKPVIENGVKSYAFNGWKTEIGGSQLADLSNITEDMTVYASFKNDKYSYISGRCIIDENESLDTAVHMNWDDGNSEDWYNLSLNFGEKFKIAWCDSEGNLSQKADFDYVNKDDPIYCFSKSDETSKFIQCWASGTYLIKYNNKWPYEGGRIYLAFIDNTRNAEQLAAKVMSYGSPDDLGYAEGTACVDRYATVKEMYSTQLSSTEKALFKDFKGSSNTQFLNAYNRYNAWASANGEPNWEIVESSSSLTNNGLNSKEEKNASMMTTIIAAVASGIILLGGYILFKKRKEQ